MIIDFDVSVVDIDVFHGGIDLLMAEDPRHLLNRHTSQDQLCCQRPPEPMRMHILHARPVSDLIEHCPDASRLEPDRSFPEEQRSAAALSALQILLQVESCHIIQIDLSLLIALAEHGALHTLEVDIADIEVAHLADPAAGAQQEEYDRLVPERFAGILQLLDLHIGEGLPHFLFLLYRCEIGARIRFDQTFPVQPAEQRIVNIPISGQRAFFNSTVLLCHQEAPQMVDRDVPDRHLHTLQHFTDHIPVMLYCLFRAPGNPLCIHEDPDQIF